jgi:hypothetical protein
MYYFIIVGGLFLLNLIYKIIRFIKSDGEDWQFQLAHDVLDWCSEMYPVRKQKPFITLVEGTSDLGGEYCFDTNTIIIYRSNNVLLRDVVKTCIHEYFHYYLITSQTKNRLYKRQLEVYGYENHPQEILCNSLSKTLSKVYQNK